jgi:hypothetical protein
MATWMSASWVKCRARVTLTQAKKQWSTVTQRLLTRESRRTMARPRWTIDAEGRPVVSSRDGQEHYVASCYDGRVSFAATQESTRVSTTYLGRRFTALRRA